MWRYFVYFSLKKELYSRCVASILIGLHALWRNQSLKGKFGRLCFLGTLPLNPRRPCVKHFTTFYALLKHVSPMGDYFTPKGHFFALGPVFCALVREEAIFVVCKRCANKGFACMCKEKVFFTTAMNTDLMKIHFHMTRHLWISYMVTNLCIYHIQSENLENILCIWLNWYVNY